VARLSAPRMDPDRHGEAPDEAILARILEVATTVPDHGSLRPWRFVVVTGPARERFGDALVAGLVEERGSDLLDAVVAKMRSKAFAAPCCVALIASPDVGANVPVWEQEASAACTGYAIVLAAQALGFGGIWKSAGTVDAPAVRRFFALSEDERLLGWVNLGTPTPPRPHREADDRRPALEDLVTVLGDDGARPLRPEAR
jgi:nitroreductase